MDDTSTAIYDNMGKLLYCYTDDLLITLNKQVNIYDMIRRNDPPEFIAGALSVLDKLKDIINNPDNFIDDD